MTHVTGNNTQEAPLSHSRCESDQEVWDDRVDLGFRSKYLYPVVTGCEEMDWSHVSHILTLMTPLLLPLFLHHHLHLCMLFMQVRGWGERAKRALRALRRCVSEFGGGHPVF